MHVSAAVAVTRTSIVTIEGIEFECDDDVETVCIVVHDWYMKGLTVELLEERI